MQDNNIRGHFVRWRYLSKYIHSGLIWRSSQVDTMSWDSNSDCGRASLPKREPSRPSHSSLRKRPTTKMSDPFSINGGSVVALVGKDCVGIACDLRLGQQALTISTDFPKIFPMGDKVFLGLTGLATDVQTLYVPS